MNNEKFKLLKNVPETTMEIPGRWTRMCGVGRSERDGHWLLLEHTSYNGKCFGTRLPRRGFIEYSQDREIHFFGFKESALESVTPEPGFVSKQGRYWVGPEVRTFAEFQVGKFANLGFRCWDKLMDGVYRSVKPGTTVSSLFLVIGGRKVDVAFHDGTGPGTLELVISESECIRKQRLYVVLKRDDGPRHPITGDVEMD